MTKVPPLDDDATRKLMLKNMSAAGRARYKKDQAAIAAAIAAGATVRKAKSTKPRAKPKSVSSPRVEYGRGQRFGKLTVLEAVGATAKGKIIIYRLKSTAATKKRVQVRALKAQ